jgi:aldose 1-epimerase
MDSLKTVTIKNSAGMEAEISNFGATILRLLVANKQKTLTNVVVGLQHPQDYFNLPYSDSQLYLGSTIGRFAGRISKGSFNIADTTYEIENNDGVHLHGGTEGFDKKFWEFTEVLTNKAVLKYVSVHLEEGYPGNLNVEAAFEVTNKNELKITYSAKTDSATIVNITTHPYINLNGSGNILEHHLTINSAAHLEVDSKLLPSGKVKSSVDTPFDRQNMTVIGRNDFAGFDDTFVLKNSDFAAKLRSDYTGIELNVVSNQPAMVVFTPKTFPKLAFNGKYANENCPAICFEPQNYPDAPNQSHFPSSILQPGQTYLNEIVFQFSVNML